MIRVEHNVETGEITEITLSAKEVKEFETATADRNTFLADLQSKAEAKSALLERLGITADEAALLLS